LSTGRGSESAVEVEEVEDEEDEEEEDEDGVSLAPGDCV
jgi:hypothetical protein